MIIDGHAHTFPPLGTDSGDQTAATQLKFIQRHTQFHVAGWRRRRDDERADPTLLMPSGDGIDDLADVDFRVGTYGRLECTVDDEDYYLQWSPCWFWNMSLPPEILVAYMNAVGVDKAVLQHDHIYGSLNEYFSECMQRYPGRFLPLAQIRQWEIGDEQLGRLEHAVQTLGLRGLYFDVEALSVTNWVDQFDDAKFEPLWDAVRRLDIPIFWYLYTSHRDALCHYLEQVNRLDRWAQAHPDIQCVHTHGMETIAMQRSLPLAERVRVSDEVWRCLKNPNVHLEIMLQLMAPDTEYPFLWAQDLLKELYEELGPQKLVWGSDMPAAERMVTYRQAMDYVRLHAEFMSPADKDLFFGGNIARILGGDRLE